jgi:DNA-binding transcriptional ArsR family regulator
MPVSETFKALGDPVRLEMISRLSAGSDYTVSRLLDGLGLSRQGARKHLQVLADVELVHLQPSGMNGCWLYVITLRKIQNPAESETSPTIKGPSRLRPATLIE